jgi:2,4-dienoyl-CoA reductase-like NADH-dependent reductase (Old Yellow Enzyme family)
MTLRHVFSPIAIGSVTIPNRVVRTAHGTGIGRGTMNDELIGYHVARARGGVGLTIVEALSVHPSAHSFLNSGAPGLVEGYRKLMAQVEPYGMKVFQQLYHGGNEIMPADGSPPWSSSETVGPGVGVLSQAITRSQIAELTDGYVKAATDAVEGGLHGVELHCAHGYLMQQFLSPLINARTDEYGGSFENRTRLPIEVLTRIRAAVPKDFVVGCRLSSELLPGGMGPDEVIAVAKAFRERGLIDYVNLTLGTDYASHKIIAPMSEATGYELPYNIPVKQAIDLPVIMTGRFRTLEEADQIIRRGESDLIAMNRAHIADPDIVRKTREGRVEEIRPCIACNHGCVGGLAYGRMGCAVNVAIGYEDTLGEDRIEKTASPRTVLVVGGGPAGLEAARVAALKGHKVILAEATDDLGGAINVAKRAPRRVTIGDIVDWQAREVYRLGVDVRLSTYMEAADVREIDPDVLIVATGSLPRVDGRQMFAPGEIPKGANLPHVISSHDLLLEGRNRDWGRTAVVYDDTGHYEGIAAAEFLIEQGVAVTFVTGHISVAPRLEASLTVTPALERLARGDFRAITRAKITGIDRGTTHVAYRYGGPPMEVPAETVVLISHNKPNRDLIDELDGASFPVIPVGDVRSPRYLQVAIREGHMAARGIA